MGERISSAGGGGLTLLRHEVRPRAGWSPSHGTRRRVARALWQADPLRSPALGPALRESQSWPPERLAELQLRLLRRIVAASSRPPPADLEGLLDLPVLRRADLEAAQSRRKPGRRVTTSGTGGSPQRVHWSVEAMRWQDAVDERSREWLGLRGWDRRVWICCNPASRLRRGRLTLANTRIVEAARIDTDASARRRIASELAADPPALLQGVSNALAAMADEFAAAGERLPDTRWLSAGNHLTPWYSRRISRLDPGPVAERYAAVEVGLIASSCRHGSLHVNAENLLVEVVDGDGRPLRDRPGEVLVTTLRNRASPLIRYAPGDVAILRSSPCGCGRTLPVIQPAGRIAHIDLAGFPPDPRALFDAIDSEGVQEARLLAADGATDVEVAFTPAADRSRNLSRIERDVAGLLPGSTVRARAVERIDATTSGKVRHIELAGGARNPPTSRYG